MPKQKKNKKQTTKNQPNKPNKNKSKPNLKIILYSIIGIICLVLTFTIDWLFIIGAVIVIYLNQRELMKDSKKK